MTSNSARGQAHAFAAAAQHPGREVEGSVAERQLVDLLALPAQQRADAGQQLAGIKRLCQIIIRPGVQPGHAVHEIGLRRQHQDGHGMVLRAQAAGDGAAVEPRHHDIEDHKIVDVRFCIFQAGQASFAVSTEKPPARQQRLQRISQQALVSTTRIFIITAPAGYSP